MTKKVLIVDDSDRVRDEVRGVLASAGFQVLEATNGLEGLDRILGTEDLSAVFCDINMPRLSGLDMLEQVKEKGLLPRLPVIMLTTDDQPELVARAKAVGAKGYIVKPFKPEHLISTVRKLTSDSRA